MKEVLFVLMVGTTTLLLQVTSMGFLMPAAYKPDLMLVLVLWASLRMTFFMGVAFAFATGVCIDLLSGSPFGLFSIIYCVSFVTWGYFHATFHIDGPAGRAAIVFGLTLAAGITVLFMMWLSGPVGFGLGTAEWMLLKSLVTALASLAAYPLLDTLWGGYMRLVGMR